MSQTADIFIRDVLAQFDRRLTRLEEGVRDRRRELGDLRLGLNAKVDAHFRWQIGVSLGLWISVMSAVLLK